LNLSEDSVASSGLSVESHESGRARSSESGD
jgi:hypothetical protein